MKIGIHESKGSFSKRWIAYCERLSIQYKIVDCYASDIVQQLSDCDALMWHFHQENYRDTLFAKQLIASVEAMGKKAFPDIRTCWHFDDKVGQKYLLEAINAPLVPTYIFYDSRDAYNWIKQAEFPKVFKLKVGAGSTNVRLVKSEKEARRLVKIAFSNGFPVFDRWNNLRERYRKVKEGKDDFMGILKGIGRFFFLSQDSKMGHPQKGYLYFQDFIEGNDSDTRIIVIGDKAFAMKRLVRKGDFRASGSGNFKYEKEEFDERCIKIAFETTEKIKAQCVAYDFVFDQSGNPLILEISYGFKIKVYDPCTGYWDKDMNWYPGNFIPQEWMVELMVKNLK